MTTENPLCRLARTARILRLEIEGQLARGLSPDDVALKAGYREAVRRLHEIERDAAMGGTAQLPALFRGLSAFLPSGSQAGIHFAAAAQDVSEREARRIREEKEED
jgi:hypothetical protein